MEARVMTVDELKALPRLSIVFIEYQDGCQDPDEEECPILAGMKCYDGTIVDEDSCIFIDFESDMKADYTGSRWRFWNTMPTEEQRRTVPWE